MFNSIYQTYAIKLPDDERRRSGRLYIHKCTKLHTVDGDRSKGAKIINMQY